MSIVVVGIGHSLRGDDAAGLEAVCAWQQCHAETAGCPAVHVSLVESSGMELISAFDGADAALLVDAVRSGAPPGTLHRLGEADLAALEQPASPMHGWGVPEALRLANALGVRPAPQRLRLVGIEAAQVDLGLPLSTEVRCAIPAAVAAIEDEVRRFLGEQ